MTRLTPRSLALAISAATAGPALAQDAAPILLDEIVITASGFAQSIADAPASITVLSGDELRRRNVTSLSDALRDVQGWPRPASPMNRTSPSAACRANTR